MNINYQDECETAPLHAAGSGFKGHMEVVKDLVVSQANVNADNRELTFYNIST